MLTLSARIVDGDTGEALPFASIGIIGRPIGTIANLDGEFDFHFPAEYRNETLMVSMLGYYNLETPIASVLIGADTLLRLKKSTTILQTLVVSDTLRGGDIVRIALSRVEENCPQKPFLLDAFYRDLKKVGGTYVSLLEAAVKIYDEDYKTPRNKFKLRERVRLLEVRRSLGYTSKFTTYFDEDNLLEEVLLHNNIRYRQFPDEEVFFNSLRREKDSYYANHEVFVVTLHEDFDLSLFVDKKNFGILHLEYSNNNPQMINKKRGLHSKFVGLRKVIDYKEYGGKLYLNYMNVYSKINWYDNTTGKLKFDTELEQHLLVNKIFPDPEERIGITEKMRRYGLQYQDQPYNKKFWEDYNTIKESPLDKKIVADLELEGPLEKQFEHN